MIRLFVIRGGQRLHLGDTEMRVGEGDTLSFSGDVYVCAKVEYGRDKMPFAEYLPQADFDAKHAAINDAVKRTGYRGPVLQYAGGLLLNAPAAPAAALAVTEMTPVTSDPAPAAVTPPADPTPATPTDPTPAADAAPVVASDSAKPAATPASRSKR